MNKINIHTRGNTRKINPDWFTGKTRIKEIGSSLNVTSQQIYHVYFEGHSRTKLHYHDGDQILIATQGRGSLELFERTGSARENFKIKRTKKVSLMPGDTVNIPAGTLHTHGSVASETFSHIALNVLRRRTAKYVTTWYESDFTRTALRIIR